MFNFLWHGDFERVVLAELKSISARLDGLERRGVLEMAAIDTLTAQVAENTSAEQSAIVLLNNLSELIRSGAGNEQAMLDLAATLDASAGALADAIVANTPAG
jgi:hypothetical protein